MTKQTNTHGRAALDVRRAALKGAQAALAETGGALGQLAVLVLDGRAHLAREFVIKNFCPLVTMLQRSAHTRVALISYLSLPDQQVLDHSTALRVVASWIRYREEHRPLWLRPLVWTGRKIARTIRTPAFWFLRRWWGIVDRRRMVWFEAQNAPPPEAEKPPTNGNGVGASTPPTSAAMQ